MADSSMFGLVQTWLSYTAYTDADDSELDATQLAFGIKRVRIGWKYSDGPFFAKFQGDGAKGDLKILDGFVGMKVNDMVTVKMGRLVGVGSQAGALTGAPKLDLIERSIVGKKWGAGTVGGDYRTIGAVATVTPSDMFKLAVQLHNGGGDHPGLLPSNSGGVDYTESPLVNDGFNPQMDFGVYAAPMDGLKVGFTYGLPNENLNTTGSMTAFAYFKMPAFYFKFDYTSLDARGDDWDGDDDDVASMGYAATLGYHVSDQMTVAGRYETWDGNTDVSADDGDYAQTNVTVGLNYFFNPDAKYDQVLKFAFTRRMDEMPDDVDIVDPNLFQIMWQIWVH